MKISRNLLKVFIKLIMLVLVTDIVLALINPHLVILGICWIFLAFKWGQQAADKDWEQNHE